MVWLPPRTPKTLTRPSSNVNFRLRAEFLIKPIGNILIFRPHFPPQSLAPSKMFPPYPIDTAPHFLYSTPILPNLLRRKTMAQSAQIQKMSHRHEQLLQFMLANPSARLRDLSLHFQMTIPWLSTIINSDAFQAQLMARQDEWFTDAVLTVSERMIGVANQGVEKLGECLADTQDPRYVLDVTDKVLHRLGYAPQRSAPPPAAPGVVHNTQINVLQADKETLERAREKMFQRNQALPEPEPIAIEGELCEPQGAG